MHRAAIQAVYKLANELWLHGDFPANWQHIDKIERRFRIVGAAWRYLDDLKRAAAQRERERLREIWDTNDNAFHVMRSPYN